MIRKSNFLLAALMVHSVFVQAQEKPAGGYPITPVPFTSVKVTDTFWGQRLKASRETTIPLAFSKCEETGRYTNFIRAAHPADSNKVTGFSFDDTDVYKTIEGASYLLQAFPDPKLERYIDSVLTLVAAAQEPDGYLYTARTQNPLHPHEWAGTKRWEKEEELSHELYNLGHMIEGAIAHYQATGKRNFLDVAMKFADCAVREVGDKPGQAAVVPGHQIAEMALAKLFVVTGRQEYLDLARFLLNKRGNTGHKEEYSQSHQPLLQQEEAVGHAVRAAYLYSGMADVAALTGDRSYVEAIDRIWENIVAKKLYITGGIGASSNGEAFGKNYDLPNMSAYCETCAAIGNVYLNYRLFLLHGDAKYFDVLERTLYNGLISGVSLDGGAFFYPNPLESVGQHQRQPWFGCACCPSNICRFIPSIPGYVYAVHNDEVFVNLFMTNEAKIRVNKKNMLLKQTTSYPWSGDILIEPVPAGKQDFTLKIRIPGWVQGQVVPGNLYSYADRKMPGYRVKVNGLPVESQPEKGYFSIRRTWAKGDRVEVSLGMEPRLVKAHPAVEADRGKVAVECGPLVYCAEWPDNDFSIFSLLLSKNPHFSVVNRPDLLHGIDQLMTNAQALNFTGEGKLEVKEVKLTLIPYYAWAHRGSGDMAVWLPVDLQTTRPVQPPSIASESALQASHPTKALRAIRDGLVPKDGNDRSAPYYHWWPKEGTTEWVTYEFAQPKTVSRSAVFWFDDAPWGGCRVPESWTIYYKNDQGAWTPVENSVAYGVEKGIINDVVFKPVTTSALKLEVKLQEKEAAGIFEWAVE